MNVHNCKAGDSNNKASYFVRVNGKELCPGRRREALNALDLLL